MLLGTAKALGLRSNYLVTPKPLLVCKLQTSAKRLFLPLTARIALVKAIYSCFLEGLESVQDPICDLWSQH